MNRVVGFLHPIIGAYMRRYGHQARRTLGGADFPGGFKWARDLNAEVRVHRQVAACGVVIEKHVVPIGAQARLGPQELSHFIERRLPRSSDTANCDMTPDGSKLHGSNSANGKVDTHVSFVA